MNSVWIEPAAGHELSVDELREKPARKRPRGTLLAQAPLVRDLLRFIDASPSPYHCLVEAERRLRAAGFIKLEEPDQWRLRAGQGYFTSRGDASLIAWRAGLQPPHESGVRLIATHTDSPNLRLKPRFLKRYRDHALLDVDVYGSPLLYTWVDRDLSLAGRVIWRHNGRLASKLVRIDRPLCRVPSLAIHLDRGVNDRGVILDRHRHLSPVIATWNDGQAPRELLRELIRNQLGDRTGPLLGHDLCLYDRQRATTSGLRHDFIHAARLDNQAMCHAALVALLEAGPRPSTALVAMLDHEEVGSRSWHGAESPLIHEILKRTSGGQSALMSRIASRSLMLSADMAQGLHPNHPKMHEPRHAPVLNRGPVLKTHVRQRYATDGRSGAAFRELCNQAGFRCQEFVNRPDLRCGTTLGPRLASRLGIATADIGNPMLSMHSVREMAGTRDHLAMTRVLLHFLSVGRLP